MEVGPVALEGEGLPITILGGRCPLPFKGKGCPSHSTGWVACPLQKEIRIIDSIYLIEHIEYTTHEYYEIHTTFILRRSDCQLPIKGG